MILSLCFSWGRLRDSPHNLIQLNPEVTMSIARLTPELTQILSEVQQLGHNSDNFLFWSFQIKDMPECDKDLAKVMQCGLTVLKDPEFAL